MARRQILSPSERESLLALPDDELTLTRMTYFSEQDLAIINAHRKPASRFGFAVLLCYLKSIGFAPDKKSLLRGQINFLGQQIAYPVCRPVLDMFNDVTQPFFWLHIVQTARAD